MLLKNVGKSLLASFFISTSLSSFNNACAQEQKLPLEGHVLEVGVSPVTPFVIINGKFTDLSGIDVDIIRELQRRIGFTLSHDRFHIMGLDELLELGQQGDLDICASAITFSPENAKNFMQSPATFRSNYVLVARPGSDIKSCENLQGRNFAAEDGTDLYDLMPKNIADQVNVIHEHTSFMLMYSVASGQADALITEKPLALNAINNWAKDKLQIIRDVKDSERTVGMLFKKGTYESQVLYETFEQMQMDGTIKNIVHKYLPNYEFPKDLMPCNIKLAKQQSDMIEPQDL